MTLDRASVRAARLTDRQALVELSRRVHAAEDAYRRSLGVPPPAATRPDISLAALIPTWLPLRSPLVHLVAELDGELVGSCRAIEEPHRDDWVIIELDAVDGPMAAEVRWHLLGGLIAEGAKKGVGRYHVACSDVRENLELFGQAGFMAYAQEEILYRPPDTVRGARSWLRGLLPGGGAGSRARRARRDGNGNGQRGEGEPITLQPAGAPDAWHLFDLWSHATPPAIARVEAYGAGDWESVGQEAIVPRSSLNPLLHFSDVDAWLMPWEQRSGGFLQHGVCREGPHYVRFLIREGIDGAAFLATALVALGDEVTAAGILAPVRTYESAGMRAARGVGFEPIGRVTMLVREVRERVRQPAMVPATR